jgi:hypothetical protein
VAVAERVLAVRLAPAGAELTRPLADALVRRLERLVRHRPAAVVAVAGRQRPVCRPV